MPLIKLVPYLTLECHKMFTFLLLVLHHYHIRNNKEIFEVDLSIKSKLLTLMYSVVCQREMIVQLVFNWSSNDSNLNVISAFCTLMLVLLPCQNNNI